MKFYNSVQYVYKCMCSGNASYPIPVSNTGKGCYTYAYVKSYDRCQRVENVTSRNEMPRTNIIEVELFDVWGIDSLRLLVTSTY